MSDLVHLTQRASFCLWVFFAICSFVDAVAAHGKCRKPEIKSPVPFLSVYQQANKVNVTVYHCLFRMESTCKCNHSDCLMEISESTDVWKPTYQYSDITQNCIHAFVSNNLKTKYGNVVKLNTPVTYKTPCVNRTATINLTKYDTEVDIEYDRVVLRSGTDCKYTSGFCHDQKEDIDVMWNVKYDETPLYNKLNNSDLYYFFLGNKHYAIIEWNGKYFPLELTNQSESANVDQWKTHKENLIVTNDKNFTNVTKEVVDPTDYLDFYFDDKQDLYDYLTDACKIDSTNGTTDLQYEKFFKKSVEVELILKEQNGSLTELNAEIQRLRSETETYFYVTVFAVICLASVVVILGALRLRKNCTYQVINNNVAGPFIPNVPTSIGNAYEYISSDYDINSVYGKKQHQLPENNKSSNFEHLYESALKH